MDNKALNTSKAKRKSKDLNSGWEIIPSSLRKTYTTRDFIHGIEIINKITDLAEEMNHHPDIKLAGYNQLSIELSTHKAHGLTEKDFDLAEKIETVFEKNGSK